MDGHQFDRFARMLARRPSRRGLLGGLAATLLASRDRSSAVAQGMFLGPGDPCRDTSQCVGADAPLVCAWNGYGNDGGLNCCTYEGSRCGFDAACCGTAMCLGGICTSQPSYASPGDPCQTTDQCNRPQTGAICEYTASTGDSRCCWYEGSLCSSGAQCCGSRVCAGGVCQFPTDGSSGGSGTACTWQGCPCVLHRDPACRASCPLSDPCGPGLVCTGTSDVTGVCTDPTASAGDPGTTDSGLNQTGYGFPPGQACIADSQCDNSYPELGITSCADTGYVYGDYGGTQHCCRYAGGSCGGPLSDDDSLCCGNLRCLGGVCGWG